MLVEVVDRAHHLLERADLPGDLRQRDVLRARVVAEHRAQRAVRQQESVMVGVVGHEEQAIVLHAVPGAGQQLVEVGLVGKAEAQRLAVEVQSGVELGEVEAEMPEAADAERPRVEDAADVVLGLAHAGLLWVFAQVPPSRCRGRRRGCGLGQQFLPAGRGRRWPCSSTQAASAISIDFCTFCSTSSTDTPSERMSRMMANMSATIEGCQAQRRLVEQHQARARHQRAADRHHLLLAAGKRRKSWRRRSLSTGSAGRPFERRLALFARGGPITAEVEVFLHRHGGEEAPSLRDQRDAVVAERVRRHAAMSAPAMVRRPPLSGRGRRWR